MLYKHCGRAKDERQVQTTNSLDLSVRKENKQIPTDGQERRTRGQEATLVRVGSWHATAQAPSKGAR